MADQRLSNKTVRFAADVVEDSESSSADVEASLSSTLEEPRKSVRFADKDDILPASSPTHTTKSVRFAVDVVQNSDPHSANDGVISSSSPNSTTKEVQFAVDDDTFPDTTSSRPIRSISSANDDMEKLHPTTVGAVNVSEINSSARKKVRFVVNDDEGRSELPSTHTTPTKLSLLSQTPYITLLDADTSLRTPIEVPDSPFPYTHQSSTNPPIKLNPTTTPIPTSAQSTIPPPLPRQYPNSPPSPFRHPAVKHAPSNVAAVPLDSGETDADGHVLAPNTGSCEKCGGRVVWATRGDWLLVCEGCGDAQ